MLDTTNAITIATDANMEGRRADALNILISDANMTLAAALDRITPVRAPEVGDILECGWGYEQTRYDFYQVIKVTPKTVTVRSICKRYVTNEGGGYATVVPVPGKFKENSTARAGKRFSHGTSRWRYSIRITDYSHAYLWDGEVCNESGDY